MPKTGALTIFMADGATVKTFCHTVKFQPGYVYARLVDAEMWVIRENVRSVLFREMTEAEFDAKAAAGELD